MFIKSLMIKCATMQVNAQYIAKQLWTQDIAKTSRITLVPYLCHDEIHQIAYVEIAMWADSEKAYKMIQQLKSNDDVNIVINDNQSWQARINIHNSGNLDMYAYTTTIPNNFYETDDELNLIKQAMASM
jgi:hypothetical protein